MVRTVWVADGLRGTCSITSAYFSDGHPDIVNFAMISTFLIYLCAVCSIIGLGFCVISLFFNDVLYIYIT